ncbi:MAG TPA: HlyU family transcriptional regulator [Kiloniellales bacterium]|nr:HlyU family transcriptional regulator [Kiloniellales bacterium]
MASFLSRLFGGGSSAKPEAAAPKRDEAVEYKGFLIQAAPEQQDGQWRVAGVIRKVNADGEQERILQRADSFATREDAAAFTIVKGKQVIDQRGDDLFADGAASGRA